MGVYRVMPFWTRNYLSEHQQSILLDCIRKEIGSANLQNQLLEAGRKQMEEAARQNVEIGQKLHSMSEKEIEEDAVKVGEVAVVHGYIMDSIRHAIVTSLYETMGPERTERESEHQLLLSVVYLAFEAGTSSVFNPRMLEEPRKAALETFQELVSPEGVQEALAGGADFIFGQSLAEIVLRDSKLHQLVVSRLGSTSFTY